MTEQHTINDWICAGNYVGTTVGLPECPNYSLILTNKVVYSNSFRVYQDELDEFNKGAIK